MDCTTTKPVEIAEDAEGSTNSIGNGTLDPGSSSASTSQRGPDAFSTQLNADLLTSAGPSNAEATHSTPSSSSKVYVLTFDAAMWAHEDTTERITLLDGRSIRVAWIDDILITQNFSLHHKGVPICSWSQDVPERIQPCGTLGVYRSEAKARRVGKKWLYDRLLRIEPGIELPLQVQDGLECAEPTWMKSGWRRTADGSWGYSISDYSHQWLALVVYVSERVIDESDPEEEYEDSDDNAEEAKYELVGPSGSRKKVQAKPQKKQKKNDGEARAQRQDMDGGDDTVGKRESGGEDRSKEQIPAGGNETAGERENETEGADGRIQDVDHHEFVDYQEDEFEDDEDDGSEDDEDHDSFDDEEREDESQHDEEGEVEDLDEARGYLKEANVDKGKMKEAS